MTTEFPNPEPPAPEQPAGGTPPTFTPPLLTPPRPPSRRSSLLISVLLGLAATIAVAGIAFAAGRLTAPVTAAAGTNRIGNFPGIGGQGGTGNGNANGGIRGAFGGIGVRGTVTAIDGNTITIKLENGQEVKVQTDSSTTYHRQAAASASDVTSGTSVIVEVQPGSGFRPGTDTTPNLKAADITVAGQ